MKMFSFSAASIPLLLQLICVYSSSGLSSSAKLKVWNENDVSKHHDQRYFRSPIRTERVKNSISFYTSSHESFLERSRVRPSQPNMNMLNQAAEAHYFEISRNYSCGRPRPTLIYVSDHLNQFASPKQYYPSCTLMFRCDKESGCCSSEGYECSPRRQQVVPKYFYVSTPDNRNNSIEIIEFVNHTECECRAINHHPRVISTRLPSHISSLEDASSSIPGLFLGLLPQQVIREVIPLVNTTPSVQESNVTLQSSSNYLLSNEYTNLESSLSSSSSSSSTTTKPETTSTSTATSTGVPSFEVNEDTNLIIEKTEKDESKEFCNHVTCPVPFVAKIETKIPLKCFCDCESDRDQICNAMKKGVKRLEHKSRRCIMKNYCLEPRCEYGATYNRQQGLCPKKESGSTWSHTQDPSQAHRD